MDKHCPDCDGLMVIDEWNGWFWTCLYCDYIGESATLIEIKLWEDEASSYKKKNRKKSIKKEK